MVRESKSGRAGPPRAPGPSEPPDGKRGRARRVLDRPPRGPHGWRTTYDDEIALRRWRGSHEIVAIEALEAEHPILGTFRARSETGGAYEVEIRGLDGFTNSCGCIDHRVNGLGTCKHIEGVLAALRRRGAKAFRAAAAAGGSRVEIHLDRRDALHPRVASPASGAKEVHAVRDWLRPWLKLDGTLREDPEAVAALVAAWPAAPAKVRRGLRVSRHFRPWLERHRRRHSRQEARAAFLAEIEAGTTSFDLVRHPLLPYQ